MTRRKKYLAISAVILAASSLAFTGCSSSTSNSTDTTQESNDTAQQDGEQRPAGNMGQITSISDTEITISQMSGGRGGGDGEAPGGDGETPEGTPPEKPADSEDGTTGGEDSEGEAPNSETPEGEAPDGEAPQGGGDMEATETTYTITDSTEFLDADGNAIKSSELTEGTMVSIETDDDNNAKTITIQNMDNMGGGPGGGGDGGGQSQAPSEYTSVTEYSEDTTVSDETFTSTGTDENAIHVTNGAKVSLDNITLTRTSQDSTGGDSSSFYGIGAGILVTDGNATIQNATITTDAAGGAGVFSYGDGIATVTDSTITTTQDTSGGIHVAGGGTLYASNLTVNTSGESSAAIRSDRGSGTMEVTGGSYTSNGTGSPAVYSTADITVSDADLTATNSEAVCIEGLNSLKLTDCNLTGNMPENEQNDCIWTVILYQSMSGDSEEGNSTFEMEGGTLTSQNGGLFYTTNTESTFSLKNVGIDYSEANDFFLKCTGNSNERGWGQAGSNGADCSFTAAQQDMQGDIIWDSISDLDMEITDGSVLTGGILQDESNAGNGGDGYANVTIDDSSSWIVTKDSTLSKLTCTGTITDADGKTVSIVDSDGASYVEGDSAYTITVNEYEG